MSSDSSSSKIREVVTDKRPMRYPRPSFYSRAKETVLSTSEAFRRSVRQLSRPDAVRGQRSWRMEAASSSAPAPHRGFSQKARDVLIGPDLNLRGYPGMPNKSCSEFDLRKKLNTMGSRKKDSSGSSPKSQSSVNSIPEQPTFDTIGERPKVKKHMKLSDIGKAHSCAELKSDKRLLRTFQEENIIKMPSMDSDIGSPQRSELEDLCLSFEGIGKSMIYSQSSDNNSNDVKDKKNKNKK